MTQRDKDYTGFDPILWVERLREVNRLSQFPAGAKTLIEETFAELIARLAR